MKLTKEQIEENLACYRQAMETNDYSNIDVLEGDPQQWYAKSGSSFFPHSIYRRKPTPTLRPWKPEEVPLGVLVRSKDDHKERSLICGTDRFHINTGLGFFTFSRALEMLEHSIDNGKTWLPCGVEEGR